MLSLGDARAYFLSTAKNELGVVSAESTAGEIAYFRDEQGKDMVVEYRCCAQLHDVDCRLVNIVVPLLLGATMVPMSWTEMQCPLTGQIEQRKVAKVGGQA
ncbi:hypothetical protein CK203_019670 [Vitis vinifera]|uniref:Uncharacterized protein n=1 Tax=Vitis vinifera TaxID=29760 RepID=A0A438JR16_VITVI|nr:hypothetical protein CK203_019670 [Vitis vinifera]